MEKDVQEPLAGVDRRLSYCEVNANAADNLRLGAGPPEEILSLPDDVTSIRFFMLEPLEGAWLRARWYRGEIDDAGKLTTHPFAHPSQDAGAWSGFIVPRVPLAARIAQGVVAGRHLDVVPDGSTTWVRVRPEGLALAGLPGPPTLASLLKDQPEARWWPVYVRLYGDTATLRNLLKPTSGVGEGRCLSLGWRGGRSVAHQTVNIRLPPELYRRLAAMAVEGILGRTIEEVVIDLAPGLQPSPATQGAGHPHVGGLCGHGSRARIRKTNPER